MPNYFAEFRDMGTFWIRHNTRIYLEDFNGSKEDGECLGAIIAKNPGSAKIGANGWGALNLDGDKMLPNVRSILLKAFMLADKKPPANAYLQVLNLFYICGEDLDEAIRQLESQKNVHADPAHAIAFRMVWYAWDGKSSKLDQCKNLFRTNFSAQNPFFYSPAGGAIVCRPPNDSELAKHPQGLLHELIVPHLATLFSKEEFWKSSKTGFSTRSP